MKKLIDLQCYVAVNGEEYYPTSYHNHLRYVDENAASQETEFSTNNWQTAVQCVENHEVRNAEIGANLWRNLPTLKIFYGDIDKGIREFTEKEFRSLKYKWVAHEVKRIYTITELAKMLPADQFCEWIKDQGIFSINIGG